MNNHLIRTLNSIKNGSKVHKKYIDIQANHFTEDVLNALYLEGYILSYQKINDISTRIFLKSEEFFSGISNVKFVSKPSNYISMTHNSIVSISEKIGTVFISTPKGILTSFDCKKKRQGGNILFVCK